MLSSYHILLNDDKDSVKRLKIKILHLFLNFIDAISAFSSQEFIFLKNFALRPKYAHICHQPIPRSQIRDFCNLLTINTLSKSTLFFVPFKHCFWRLNSCSLHSKVYVITGLIARFSSLISMLQPRKGKKIAILPLIFTLKISISRFEKCQLS